MKNNKSPGNDGLTKEFYLAYFPLIGDLLVNCLNYSFITGELTSSKRQAIITLIEKSGKDVRLLKSWRPISLLNVDVKLLSSVLSSRIKVLLPKLISQNQSAFVSNRNISDPIRINSDIMYYCKNRKEKHILFAADFAVAFDSISHNFLFETLKKFGFSNNFIRWVKILHKNIESCVLIDGLSTGYFTLKRGTRQGDQLAPYLSILMLEILGVMVKDNRNIQGVKIGDNELKYCMFADDTRFSLKILILLLNSKKSLKYFQNILS